MEERKEAQTQKPATCPAVAPATGTTLPGVQAKPVSKGTYTAIKVAPSYEVVAVEKQVSKIMEDYSDYLWVGHFFAINEMRPPFDCDFTVLKPDLSTSIQMIYNTKNKLLDINWCAVRILLDNFKLDVPQVSKQTLWSQSKTLHEVALTFLEFAPRGDVYFIACRPTSRPQPDVVLNLDLTTFASYFVRLFREQMPYTRTQDLFRIVQPCQIPTMISLRHEEVSKALALSILKEPQFCASDRAQEHRIQLTLLGYLLTLLRGEIPKGPLKLAPPAGRAT